MTQEQLQAELARVLAENKALKERQAKDKFKGFKIAIGQKGNVVVYGLQRYPVSLYAPGWLFLISKCEQIKAFIEEHHSELSFDKTEQSTASAPTKADVVDGLLNEDVKVA